MKYLVAAFIVYLSLFTVPVHAQTVSYSPEVLAQIQEIRAKLAVLQAELAAILAEQASSTPAVQPTLAAPDAAATGIGAEGETVQAIPAPAAKRISVTSSTDRITITNTSDVAVRIKNLSVVSGKVYQIFRGNMTYQAEEMNCNGPKSYYPMYNGYDGCLQRTGNTDEPVNELAPGESLQLRVMDGGTDFIYQPGNIVEVATGNNVEY